jgi:hypothetical protein
MRARAPSSGISLSEEDAGIVKGMLERGDRQHDIAAWFGVNSGRVAEIATGAKFRWVLAAPRQELPPPGPYPCGREAVGALQALEAAKRAFEAAETVVRTYTRQS